MRRRIVLITLGAVCAALGVAAGFASTRGSSAPGVTNLHYAQVVLGGDVYPFAVYVPPDYRDAVAVPLVVVVHGCDTTAAQQAAASGYDTLAARRRFIVLYPDVDLVDADQGRCWRAIWDPSGDGRGRGDAAAIAAMTRSVIARWRVDRSRVYVIGISAGAFETSALGADYPDVYAAIGIHSGGPYLGADQGCLGGNDSPADTAALSRAAVAAAGPRARVMPVIVLHGDADHTVPYRCGEQTIAQWLHTDDLVLEHERVSRLRSAPSVTSGSVPHGHPYTVASYTDRRGCPVAQLWTIHGMAHYWSGGSADLASARYSDPRGPSAAAASWVFFSHWRLTGRADSCVGAERAGGVARAGRG